MSEREDRLAAVYDAHAPRVHAYALRHCGPDGADDVLAEVFAVAWRRLDVLPDPPIGWLIVTARHVVAGRRRAERRQLHLARLYADQQRREDPGAEELVVRRDAVLRALDRLTDREREALLLTAWDGLGTEDAAAVARCSPRAFRARRMRARARLAALLTDLDTPAPERTRT